MSTPADQDKLNPTTRAHPARAQGDGLREEAKAVPIEEAAPAFAMTAEDLGDLLHWTMNELHVPEELQWARILACRSYRQDKKIHINKSAITLALRRLG